jgi:hypothetical protein
VNVTAPGGLVPPRPNLGPEPWSESQSPQVALIALTLLVLMAAAAIYAIWRRRRNARRNDDKRPPVDRPDATARERLIGLSGSLREALSDRFGPAYRARTIEELFADSQLGEALGVEPLEQLTHFLVQVDQLKFAPERANRDQQVLQLELAEWTPRVASLTTQIRAKNAATGDKKPRILRRATRA